MFWDSQFSARPEQHSASMTRGYQVHSQLYYAKYHMPGEGSTMRGSRKLLESPSSLQIQKKCVSIQRKIRWFVVYWTIWHKIHFTSTLNTPFLNKSVKTMSDLKSNSALLNLASTVWGLCKVAGNRLLTVSSYAILISGEKKASLNY